MIEDLLLRHSRQGLLIDTNLLVLLVIGLVKKQLISISKRTSRFSEQDFDQLVALIQLSQGPLLTTPHVLAETSNLVSDALAGDQRQVAMHHLRELVVTDLVEHQISGQDAVSDPAFMDLGLTDSGIATLKALRCLVLTADGPLCARLQARGIPVFNFLHLSPLQALVRGR